MAEIIGTAKPKILSCSLHKKFVDPWSRRWIIHQSLLNKTSFWIKIILS